MGSGISRPSTVQSFQKLILGKGTGLNEKLLKSLSDKIGVYCPWFREEGSLDKETWDRVGEALRDAQEDDLTLYLWELVKDAIEKDFVRILDSTQIEFGESPMRHPPERSFSEEGTLGLNLREYRDFEDEPVVDGEVQTDRLPGICPRCQRGYHWAGGCKSRTDLQGRPLQGNGKRGPPQTPSRPHSAVYGATELQSSQGNLFLNSSEQPQEVRDWTSVPPPTQY